MTSMPRVTVSEPPLLFAQMVYQRNVCRTCGVPVMLAGHRIQAQSAGSAGATPHAVTTPPSPELESECVHRGVDREGQRPRRSQEHRCTVVDLEIDRAESGGGAVVRPDDELRDGEQAPGRS